MKRRSKKAVAPVLATLLMIAVAVSMSVIIFMWSQSFLAQTSESTGGQQGAQNQAAQSSIAIETTTFSGVGTSTQNIFIVVRNVGAVSVSLGSISVTGISSNSGFQGSLLASVDSDGKLSVTTSSSGTWANTTDTTDSLATISKGGSVNIELEGTSLTSSLDTFIKSGDVITIKVTTDVGTFAQSSYTVP